VIGPFPEDTTLILCGFLIAQGIVKPVPALIIVYSGVLLSDYSLYFVGKKYGWSVITHKRMGRFISPERISFIEDKFKKWGVLVIILGRHLVGLRAQVIIVAGILRMSATKFLVTDGFSSIFTVALMAGAGYVGGHSLQIIERDMRRVEHFVVLFLVISLAIYFIFRYFKMRKK
jgi:membrane protein DedA with SNARE-associated domain